MMMTTASKKGVTLLFTNCQNAIFWYCS